MSLAQGFRLDSSTTPATPHGSQADPDPCRRTGRCEPPRFWDEDQKAVAIMLDGLVKRSRAGRAMAEL